jgi:hypothetical protein
LDALQKVVGKPAREDFENVNIHTVVGSKAGECLRGRVQKPIFDFA